MKTVSFTEFRKHASELLTLVEQGEVVRILRHGKAIARIVPAEKVETIPAWKSPVPRLVTSGASLAKAILAERESTQ